MDLVFLGSGAFGLPSLRALADTHRIRGIVTQPDRPAGRGGRLTPTPISKWAQESLPEVPILKPESVGTRAARDEIRGIRADAWVVIAFGQKLGPKLLDGIFAVNLHGSRLPRWRGAAPINWAILGGDRITGNSAITIADRMDAGEILGQSQRPIDPLQTAGELHDALALDGPALILDVLDQYAQGELNPQVQDESAVTLAPKLSRQRDAWVDLNASAEQCRQRIHGLTPWPGVTLRFRETDLKPLRVQVEPDQHDAQPPGTLLDAERGLIATGEQGVLRLLEVQPTGKRAMTWQAFAAGRHPETGERLESAGTPC